MRKKQTATILGYKNGLPIIAVWLIPDTRSVAFMCPHCGNLHTHGRGSFNASPGSANGHVVGHCFMKYQFIENEYFLEEVVNPEEAGLTVRMIHRL